jgi:hypothetical protein
MRHVTDFVPLSDADDGGKVVLHDAQVIAMIGDVGGQKQRVTPADDPLLAQIGRVPVDFELQLVRLDDLGRREESLAKLRQKGDVAVRRRLVIRESGIGELLRATRGGALDERAASRVVPRLRICRARQTHQHE